MNLQPNEYLLKNNSSPVCNPSKTPLHQVDQGFGEQVKEFFIKLFNTQDWPPRWYCGNWTNFHGWFYILSDVMIGVAYFAIPFLLFRIVIGRKDLPFSKIFWLFIAFILCCGATHFLDAFIFWWPAYRLSALLRFITGVVSVVTVIALYKILPQIKNLRTLEQLEAEIEERKKAEEEARHHQLLQEATSELMKKKDEFMSIASHELKTPITSVKASLQVVQRMVKGNEALKPVSSFVDKATNQLNKVTSIINDLLDVTRIQAGKLELVKKEFPLIELINESADECSINNSKHRINIKGDETIIVYADKNRLEQVLCNLVTNAIKYSPASDEVIIKFEKSEAGKVKVMITDFGIGIPEDKIHEIFDRFFRVENTSQNFSGIGLGLYISSEIIKEHQGTIGVTSAVGKGSTFWFTV